MAVLRGLLAGGGFTGEPVKGVYFFPGEGASDVLWTCYPVDIRDRHWNTDPPTRGWVLDRMVAAHVNTVVASYWSNMPQWSPMQLTATSWTALVDAVQDRPLVILPALEGGIDPDHPETPQWAFDNEFPFVPGTSEVAPGLIERIGQLCDIFADRMSLWATLYGGDGIPRHAVNIIHACSTVLDPGVSSDEQFACAFDTVASQVRERFGVDIGFTLDTIGGQRYSPAPRTSGPWLADTPSVLAIHGFESEVFSGLIRNGPAGRPPHDNNADNNISAMADWKSAAMNDWIESGVPVVMDASNGFDGRKVWNTFGTGIWGDNLDYTDDRWRNWMSELKNPGIVGISVDCWNGYTEGYAMVPSCQHGNTAYNWLTDLLEPDPRDYSHMHYVNHVATHRVYGAICEKWIKLRADRGFGAPVTDELTSGAGRSQEFTDGKSIYWGPGTGAYELHGLIAQAYRQDGAGTSPLGLPISDEEPFSGGRRSRFQFGEITWHPGDPVAKIHYGG